MIIGRINNFSVTKGYEGQDKKAGKSKHRNHYTGKGKPAIALPRHAERQARNSLFLSLR